MARIFISYRREDTAGHAAFFNHLLSQHFGQHDIFRDIDTIEPGMDFVEEIQREVASCHLLIAVIGKQWLTITDESGRRRIDNPNDFVRLEIATALHRNIRVIPVLVHGAQMPQANELPADLALLARRNAFTLHNESFAADTTRLVPSIERVLHQATPTDRLNQPSETNSTTKKYDELASNLTVKKDSLSTPVDTITTEPTSKGALATYFDRISELLKQGLRESNVTSELRRTAESYTYATLPKLNPLGKGMLLKFLYQEELIIKPVSCIFLKGADLQEADLQEADLRGANLRGTNLQGANLQGANLQEADLSNNGILMPGVNLQGANLQRADLQGADLQGADLQEADLQGANLQKANLQRADLRGANLQEADLQGANLFGAILRGADLRGADLQRANLFGANLQAANLQRADLRGVINLTQGQLKYAWTNAETKLLTPNQ